MNKVVCYTCITGNYDKLIEPKVKSENIDFICFSDNPTICANSKTWKYSAIPNNLYKFDNIRKQRLLKIRAHEYLSDYTTSIWIDGNVQITKDLNDFISLYDLNKTSFYARLHPTRTCIYAEAAECLRRKRGNEDEINKQISQYKKENVPSNIGLYETCILLRNHNQKICIILENLWSREIIKYSYRDQLSLSYVCRNISYIPGILNKNADLRRDQFFKLISHCSKT